MKRKGQYFDKRIKLEKGDNVKLTKKARTEINKKYKLDIKPNETFRVKDMEFDAGQGKRGVYFVILSLKGQDTGLYLSDVIFAY